MLDYQVQYWKNEETKRTNLANEAIKVEQNRIAQQQAEAAAEQARIAGINAKINAMNAETQRTKAQYDYELGKYQAKASMTSAQANWQNALTNIEKQSTYQQATNSQSSVNAQRVAESQTAQNRDRAYIDKLKSETIGQNISNNWANANNFTGMLESLTSSYRNAMQGRKAAADSVTGLIKAYSSLIPISKK